MKTIQKQAFALLALLVCSQASAMLTEAGSFVNPSQGFTPETTTVVAPVVAGRFARLTTALKDNRVANRVVNGVSTGLSKVANGFSTAASYAKETRAAKLAGSCCSGVATFAKNKGTAVIGAAKAHPYRTAAIAGLGAVVIGAAAYAGYKKYFSAAEVVTQGDAKSQVDSWYQDFSNKVPAEKQPVRHVISVPRVDFNQISSEAIRKKYMELNSQLEFAMIGIDFKTGNGFAHEGAQRDAVVKAYAELNEYIENVVNPEIAMTKALAKSAPKVQLPKPFGVKLKEAQKPASTPAKSLAKKPVAKKPVVSRRSR